MASSGMKALALKMITAAGRAGLTRTAAVKTLRDQGYKFSNVDASAAWRQGASADTWRHSVESVRHDRLATAALYRSGSEKMTKNYRYFTETPVFNPHTGVRDTFSTAITSETPLTGNQIIGEVVDRLKSPVEKSDVEVGKTVVNEIWASPQVSI